MKWGRWRQGCTWSEGQSIAGTKNGIEKMEEGKRKHEGHNKKGATT